VSMIGALAHRVRSARRRTLARERERNSGVSPSAGDVLSQSVQPALDTGYHGGDLMSESTVFVVDDDPSVLRAIARLLSPHFRVRTFDLPESFLDALQPDASGCVLLDLVLPGVSGLELQAQLIASGCMQPVVFLSGHGSVRSSVQAMRAGALDFIEKPWENDVLISTVRRALERDRETCSRRDASVALSQRLGLLTPRETEVFRHVIAGLLNKQIAARLGTAEKTIKVHRARVMHKMSVRSVAELTRAAERVGLQPI
jgi:FixJ family two-component response regulator